MRIEKIEIAIVQLETSISLFEQKNYISSLTLAGAAEEILDALLKQDGKSIIVTELSEVLKKGLKSEDSDKSIRDKYLNKARNQTKHANCADENIVEINYENEATCLISRAIVNLQNLTGYTVSNHDSFVEASKDNPLWY
jgi:hypothetical protein